MDFSELENLGTKQFGLVTRRQGIASFGEHNFDAMIRRAQVVRIYRSVYRVAGAPTSRWQSFVAALLASPEATIVSHFSALELHNCSITSYVSDDVHVSTSHQSAHRSRGIRTHRARRMLPAHVIRIDGIPCTSMARTIADLAAYVDMGSLARLMDDAVVSGKCDYSDIDRVLDDCGSRGRRGTVRLRELLAERVGIDTADANALVLRVLKVVARKRLPKPETEYRIWRDKRRYDDLDIAWPELKVSVEADGFNSHAKSKKRFDHDRERNNYLLIEKWETLHFTARMKDATIAEYLHKVLDRQATAVLGAETVE